MITTTNLETVDGDFIGVEVTSNFDGGSQRVTVCCEYPPLAIELLEHALVAMRAKYEAIQMMPAIREVFGVRS